MLIIRSIEIKRVATLRRFFIQHLNTYTAQQDAGFQQDFPRVINVVTFEKRFGLLAQLEEYVGEVAIVAVLPEV